jgi:lipopolysaccharide/colanic/teichoic acid biosynthesis glycosyltransferase
MLLDTRPAVRVSESENHKREPIPPEPVVQRDVKPRHPAYLPLKFMIEWTIAFVLLTLSSPLLLVMAIAVKLTSVGPAFYAQSRMGRDGRIYKMFKVRTMIHNAEKRTGAVWAAKDDVRTTSVGRILRRTHLDELPQLFNVMRGDMGLIGPRPERPEIIAKIEPNIPGYRLRLKVRPGITGLAQMLVSADDPGDRRMLNVRRKLAHDVYYVREVNLLLDLRIAICTPIYFLAEATESVRDIMVRSYGTAVKRRLAPADTEDERYMGTSLFCLAEEGSESKPDYAK